MTAVEWLVQELCICATEEEMNIIIQAEEMEKQQIENAFYDGCFDTNSWRAEEYYNETFKQQEQ